MQSSGTIKYLYLQSEIRRTRKKRFSLELSLSDTITTNAEVVQSYVDCQPPRFLVTGQLLSQGEVSINPNYYMFS